VVRGDPNFDNRYLQNLFLFSNDQTASGAHQPPIQWVPGIL